MDSSQTKRGVTPNGGHNSDEILSDIRHTRERMDHTLDELGDKLQPRHMVEDAVDYFWTRERAAAGKAKQSAAQLGRKVVDEVREHPLPSLLIGAGVVWLLSQQRERTRYGAAYEQEEGGPGLKEKASQALSGAKEKLQHGTEAAKERASEIGQKARDKMSSAFEGTKEKSAEMKEKAAGYYNQASQSVRDTMETHPLAVGIGCLAAGLIAGVMAPRTRMEDETFGETADRIKEEGKRQAQDIANKGQAVANEALEAGKEKARQEDLTPEGLTGRAEEISNTGEQKAGPAGPGI